MSEIKIWCIVLGGERPFPVDIGGNRMVGHLKTLIKQHQKPDLDGFAANKLELYQLKGVAFDESGKHLEKIGEISENLGGQDSPKLNPWKKLSTIEFPEDMLHILVVPPAGESIIQGPVPASTVEQRKGSGLGSHPPLLNTLFTETLERRQDSSLGSQAHALSSSSLACGQHALMRS